MILQDYGSTAVFDKRSACLPEIKEAQQKMRLKNKDILGIAELTPEEITSILDRAKEMKKIVLGNRKKVHYLKGKTVLTLFYENSTRTRVSFELAGKYMSANTLNISATSSRK